MSKAQWIKENQREGETYAGLLLGEEGQPDQHIFMLLGEAENVTWEQAKEWAEKAGGSLPTRREQSLLLTNAKGQFKSAWYWSGEEYQDNENYAWYQYVGYGYQCYDHKGSKLRARAVRRLPI